jgi:hypothetical protein
MTVEVVQGSRVLHLAHDGHLLASESDAIEIVNDAFTVKATIVAVPIGRFDDMFFHLSTRIAPEFIQTVVNYRVRLVILGDLSDHLRSSHALRSFVSEANRGEDVWFLADEDALQSRLASPVRPGTQLRAPDPSASRRTPG